MTVRVAGVEDAESILKIYKPYVINTSVTFEVEVPTVDEMKQRILGIMSVYPWFVYEDCEGVKGYAYASKHRERSAYRWSVDFGIYVRQDSHGLGIGRKLYTVLIDSAAGLGYYNAFGIITLPNEPSIVLHEKLGFKQAGVTVNCGFKLGAWHDVGIWQLPLREAAGEPAEPLKFSII